MWGSVPMTDQTATRGPLTYRRSCVLFPVFGYGIAPSIWVGVTLFLGVFLVALALQLSKQCPTQLSVRAGGLEFILPSGRVRR